MDDYNIDTRSEINNNSKSIQDFINIFSNKGEKSIGITNVTTPVHLVC